MSGFFRTKPFIIGSIPYIRRIPFAAHYRGGCKSVGFPRAQVTGGSHGDGRRAMRTTSNVFALGKNGGISLVEAKKLSLGFAPKTFLATAGVATTVVNLRNRDAAFSQGDPADAVFYIQKGKVQLTVVSKIGKEATLGRVSEGEFFGEGSLAGQALRMGSATAMTDCELLRSAKKEMMLALHRESGLSDLFVAYLLAAGMEHPIRRGFS